MRQKSSEAQEREKNDRQASAMVGSVADIGSGGSVRLFIGVVTGNITIYHSATSLSGEVVAYDYYGSSGIVVGYTTPGETSSKFTLTSPGYIESVEIYFSPQTTTEKIKKKTPIVFQLDAVYAEPVPR